VLRIKYFGGISQRLRPEQISRSLGYLSTFGEKLAGKKDKIAGSMPFFLFSGDDHRYRTQTYMSTISVETTELRCWLVAFWIVVRPITLLGVVVVHEVRLTTDLLPPSAGTFAKALHAIPFRSHLARLGTRSEFIALIRCPGSCGSMSGLYVAVFVVFIADGPGPTLHTIGPVTPVVSRIPEQLLPVLEIAILSLGNVFVAVVVFHAIVRVREEAVGLGASEIDRWLGLFAGPAVAITFAAIHLLRKVAPLVLVVVQVISLAEHVAHATVVTLPVS